MLRVLGLKHFRLVYRGSSVLRPSISRLLELPNNNVDAERLFHTYNSLGSDEVSAGDVLCEIQTDKAIVALEAEDDGILAKILIPENKPNIQVGALIAVLANPDEDWKEVAASAPSATETPSAEKPKTVPEASVLPPSPAALPETPSHAVMPNTIGPAARLLLQSHGLDGTQIPSTGPRGQLLKGDILSFLQSHPEGTAVQQPQAAQQPAMVPGPTFVAPAATALFTDIPLSNMRITIAKRLTQSKSTIPHAYVRSVATLDRILELRKVLKSNAGLKLSVNDMIIKACAIGLRLVPEMNALSDPTGHSVVRQSAVDICMAVATPAGLITPILRNADQTPISKLSTSAVGLAKKARDGKLQPHEFQGGSFTLSNLGMFGISHFTAIINPPQLAILAVGTGVPRAVSSPNDEFGLHFASRMTLTLSVDSRHVDDIIAGRFLTHVSRLLSNHPEWLLADDPAAMRALGRDASPDAVPGLDVFDNLMMSPNTHSPVVSPTKRG